MKRLKLIVAGFFASLLGAAAQSLPLTPTGNNLYNTGYNGNTLATSSQQDTHYFIQTPGYGPTYQATPLASGWVIVRETAPTGG